MRVTVIYFVVVFFATSCTQHKKVIVSSSFIDSLIQQYNPTRNEELVRDNIEFWKKRMDSLPDNYVNGPKYASALSARFRLYGDIDDLLQADSLMKECNIANKEKEGDVLLSLASYALMQHQFQVANQYVQKAKLVSDDKYGITMTEFDAAFEAGSYQKADTRLRSISHDSSFNYFFRLSKYEHYGGELDRSIVYMLDAAEAATNTILKQTAFSNAADLYIHKGDLEKAYHFYKKSLDLDASDFHSLTGIGWISLVHDKNDALAEKIFLFIDQHTSSPDIYLKLEQLAEAKGDSIAQKKWATMFATQAEQPQYGNMYNKYLIGLYTGILNIPGKAVAIAEKEINERFTPQTYAWYCWALLRNNEKEKAYNTFKAHVSGRPLEGLELYYMGKLMQSMDKGYNAQQFFKTARKNKYDLSPGQAIDLEKNLE